MRIFGKDTSEPVPMTWGRQLGIAGMILALVGLNIDTNYSHPILSVIGLTLVAFGVVLIGIRLVTHFGNEGGISTDKTPNGN
jgi:hypothetical protein